LPPILAPTWVFTLLLSTQVSALLLGVDLDAVRAYNGEERLGNGWRRDLAAESRLVGYFRAIDSFSGIVILLDPGTFQTYARKQPFSAGVREDFGFRLPVSAR